MNLRGDGSEGGSTDGGFFYFLFLVFRFGLTVMINRKSCCSSAFMTIFRPFAYIGPHNHESEFGMVSGRILLKSNSVKKRAHTTFPYTYISRLNLVR